MIKHGAAIRDFAADWVRIDASLAEECLFIQQKERLWASVAEFVVKAEGGVVAFVIFVVSRQVGRSGQTVPGKLDVMPMQPFPERGQSPVNQFVQRL